MRWAKPASPTIASHPLYPVAADATSPLPKQRDAPIEGLTYSDSLAWITPDTNPTGSREGVVDMSAYGAWLKANYGITLQ